jgi:pyruvate ferredoxin oxidoreductase gamma subunit
LEVCLIEIRIHGRGGQGNVVAAYLLATAAIKEGRFAQAFPAFGAERRGAPVTAFVRIADRPIKQHSQINRPAFLIVQDQALLQVPHVVDGLVLGGGILVDSLESTEEISTRLGRDVVALCASRLAKIHLGRPVPNTALLTGFIMLTNLLSIESLVAALSIRFKGEVLEQNIALIRAATEQVSAGLWQEVAHAASN